MIVIHRGRGPSCPLPPWGHAFSLGWSALRGVQLEDVCLPLLVLVSKLTRVTLLLPSIGVALRGGDQVDEVRASRPTGVALRRDGNWSARQFWRALAPRKRPRKRLCWVQYCTVLKPSHYILCRSLTLPLSLPLSLPPSLSLFLSLSLPLSHTLSISFFICLCLFICRYLSLRASLSFSLSLSRVLVFSHTLIIKSIFHGEHILFCAGTAKKVSMSRK